MDSSIHPSQCENGLTVWASIPHPMGLLGILPIQQTEMLHHSGRTCTIRFSTQSNLLIRFLRWFELLVNLDGQFKTSITYIPLPHQVKKNQIPNSTTTVKRRWQTGSYWVWSGQKQHATMPLNRGKLGKIGEQRISMLIYNQNNIIRSQ